MREHPISRRALLKATGALGTVTALPVDGFAKAKGAEVADTELLSLGRRLEALWVREHELAAESERLYELARQAGPPLAPELLAYERDGERLVDQHEDGRSSINGRVLDDIQAADRRWRFINLCEGPCPEADLLLLLLLLLQRWRDARRAAEEACGAPEIEEKFERLIDEISALCT